MNLFSLQNDTEFTAVLSLRSATLPMSLGVFDVHFSGKLCFDKGASSNFRIIAAVWMEIWAILEKYRRLTKKVRPRVFYSVGINFSGFLIIDFQSFAHLWTFFLVNLQTTISVVAKVAGGPLLFLMGDLQLSTTECLSASEVARSIMLPIFCFVNIASVNNKNLVSR